MRKLLFVFKFFGRGFFFIFINFGKLTILHGSGTRFGMSDEFVHDTRIDFDEKIANVRIEQIELTIQFGKFEAVEAEVHQPIKALALTFDRVRKTTFFPLTANENFTAGIRNKFVNLSGDTFRITGETSGVQNKHSFVNVESQSSTPDK